MTLRPPEGKVGDTFLGLFFGGLAACVGNPRDGFYLALADGGWVEDQLWWPGETHGQPRRTHEDPGDSWKGSGVRKDWPVGLPTPPAPPSPSTPSPSSSPTVSLSLLDAIRTLSCPQKQIHSLIFRSSFALGNQFPPNSSCYSAPVPKMPICSNNRFSLPSPGAYAPLRGFHLPAKAGLTGLDPLRFFTGTVGTLRERRAARLVLTRGAERARDQT